MKSKIINLLTNRKFLFSLLPVFLVMALFIFWPHISHASDLGNAVTKVVGWIVYGIVWVLGKILIILINIVIWVAQYNDFINAKAVINGWKILRDVCNMFFVLILLVIAFATTLNRESYSMKALLPKFIIAAILINFSKLICGVIIDFAQVIMLTFVNGFRDIGGGNLADMLGITKLLSISADACGSDISEWTIMGSFILALIYIIVATVVICVILFVLIMRMVMIWIYVVLSPMAWLLSVLPATQKYANQWWQQFSETVATGPILAFFIWLSFASATLGSSGQDMLGGLKSPSAAENEGTYINGINSTSDPCASATDAGSTDSMLKFVISIGLLMGGLIITKQAGGAIGGIAGAGLSKIQNSAKGVRDWSLNKAKGAAVNSSKAVARTGIGLAGYTAGKAGNLTNKVFGGKAGESLQKGGQFMKDWRTDMKETRQKAKETKRRQTLEKLGMKERSMDSYKEFQKTTLARSAKGVAMAGVGLATGNPLMMAGGVLAGAGMTTYALKSKKIAGKIKDYAVNSQKERNLKKAKKGTNSFDTQMTDEKATELDKLAAAHNSKINAYDTAEKRDLDAQKKKNEDEMHEAKGKGYGKDFTDKLAEEHQEYLDKISGQYGKLKTEANDKYGEDVKDVNDNLKKKYAGKTTNKQEYYEATKETVDRDKKVKAADKTRDDALKKNQEVKESEIKTVKSKFSGLARDMELKKLDSKYASFDDNINNRHKQEVEGINTRYKDVPAETSQLRSWDKKKLDDVGNYVEKYQPNKLSIKAAEAGSKELKSAKDTIYQLGIEDLGKFKGNDFSTGKGITSEQLKMFKELAGAGDDAKKAIANMVKGLKDMKVNSANLSTVQKGFINDMKKGFAYFQAEKPDEASALSAIKAELDNLDTGHDKGWIKVEDFGPKKK